jgi:hypothetical protein
MAGRGFGIRGAGRRWVFDGHAVLCRDEVDRVCCVDGEDLREDAPWRRHVAQRDMLAVGGCDLWMEKDVRIWCSSS